ncbi:MAG: 30S ribosomal protein S7 [Patescibacteria group bacterium]|nr:MAG: 30S ribosomal protein S7 [Patescibacteria group bacterium]
MRHAKIQKRQIEPDKIYNNVLVAKLINRIMRDGKKTIAEKHVYTAFKLIKEQTDQDPLQLFEKAVQNVGPKMEIKARRIGGANFQVPVEVKHDRRIALAIRWIIEAARKRPNKEYHTFAEKLAAELIAAANNEGEAIRKRDMTLRQAEANKAFATFRW